MNIRDLISNTDKLSYRELCSALIERFGVKQTMKWDSVLPHAEQQTLFGGEVLRLISDHPTLANQKEIRPVCLMKGELSQLLFFYVQLKDEKLPKATIERIARKFVGGAAADRYIIWFFGNTTADVLKIVISGKEGKKIRLKTLALEAGQWFKTYDYILSEVEKKFNTGGLFQQFKEPYGLWKAVWEAFDISIVNKKFYAEIKAVFDALTKEELPKCKGILTNEQDRVQFAIRLIGRIIFCWFLKRKGIIANDVLSSIAAESPQNYYRDLLELLFFDVFNTPLSERKKDLTDSIKNYPFLNGGLFEPQHQDHKDNWALNISNSWFINFFNNTLERYNFTVDENSAASSEIAIDPEMLGRIFENLLAEHNPETGESARKATGSYYTPREIVDYMVEESLIAYLKTMTGNKDEAALYPLSKGIKPLSDEAIENFVHTADLSDEIKTYSKELLNHLNAIKVLDPACGSGAFPISMLQKLVGLKLQLDPKKTPYDLKLKTIENSIYGVDIQPMATELSRLRCWLSLIVDEDPKDIKPLPNLDFKFVTANSLIDLGYDEFILKVQTGKIGSLFLTNYIKNLDALKAVRQKYFEPSLQQRAKDKLKKEFNNIKDDLFKLSTELIKQKLLDAEFATKITRWDPFDDSNPAPFFNKSWMFGVEDGFDVVIANPPYIFARNSAAKGLSDSDKRYFYKHYELSEYQLNLYPLFIEKGTQLLIPNGHLCFITPNNWLTINTNRKLRKFVLEKSDIIIVNFYARVFESADVDSSILIFQKAEGRKVIRLFEYSDDTFLFIKEVDSTFFLGQQNHVINIEAFKGAGISELLFKIELASDRLRSVADVKAGLKAYEVGKGNPPQSELMKKNRIYHATRMIDNTYVKYLDGKDVCRYRLNWSGEYLKYGDNLAAPRKDFLLYSTKRILVRQIPAKPPYCIHACYVEETFLNDLNSVNVINIREVPEAILGIINSRLISFWFIHKFGKMQRETFPQFKVNELADFPLPKKRQDKANEIANLSKQILSAKKNTPDADTRYLEREIDEMVYKLYALTPDEIAIVEGENAVK